MSGPGVYVSIPFCAQKCTYCNFRSDVYSRPLRSEYLNQLARELCRAEIAPGGTLYFGGGSPSLLEPQEFSVVSSNLPDGGWDEATLEIAPGEATPDRVRAWAACGIDRASLGVQSFDRAVARAAGRKHGPETVEAEIDRLVAAGIRTISVDLIAGLAHQTPATWSRSLEWVERLAVDHVSVYMLETDDDSRLGRELRSGGTRYGAPDVPSEDLILDLYLEAVERLVAIGFERYEVSNFARRGKRGRHNLRYWTLQPYLGFGSDAHSFDGHRRWSNVSTAPEYVERMKTAGSARATFEELGPEQLLEDKLLTGLRTRAGVRFDSSEWRKVGPRAEPLVAQGWLVADGPSLRLTDRGLLFADEAIADLLA